jgi:hypothetical protein
MAQRISAAFLILATILFIAPFAAAQQNPKPFTQDQVQGMVREELADESGAS